MNPKITPDHLGRGAVVYVRQSTMGQVVEHTESQRRQYALAETASIMGFASVATIDDDLGRSGSGAVERPWSRAGMQLWRGSRNWNNASLAWIAMPPLVRRSIAMVCWRWPTTCQQRGICQLRLKIPHFAEVKFPAK